MPASPTPVRSPVRVAVLNDFEIVVQGVARMLEKHPDKIVVVDTSTGIPDAGSADVLLYDTFGQAQGNVLDVAELVRRTRARVVLFSWNLDAGLVSEALRRGASGYLSKTLDGDGLAEALVRVAAGERVLPRDHTADGQVHGSWPGQEYGLTARESEMVALIVQGYSNQEIADRSYLSINSVKTYVRTTYRKLGFSRRSQAVRWGLEHGFLPPGVSAGGSGTVAAPGATVEPPTGLRQALEEKGQKSR